MLLKNSQTLAAFSSSFFRAGDCTVSLSNLVSDSEDFRGSMSPQRVMEMFTLTNVVEAKACHDTNAKQISDFLTKMVSKKTVRVSYCSLVSVEKSPINSDKSNYDKRDSYSTCT